MSQNLFEVSKRSSLKWMNEPNTWSFEDDNVLVIETPPKVDFFKDPGGKHVAHSAPFLYMDVASTFELTTQVEVDMLHLYDSGCLMIMADENNWAKLCFESNGQHSTIVSVVTQNGMSDDCNSERVFVEQPYLKITKVDKVISFYYSLDGEEWKLIRYFGMVDKEKVIAGVVAQSPTGNGCRVSFKHLKLDVPTDASRF
ncbi:DUF1349 domain-containing protein [Paenibacillus sp. JNUCC31]|uniref:DUF1349 domain-containing protein n=1 Tax=Paenibacillus sp. JNUCC-31 TaxID=2777983 RepID=UPI0017832F75|nr:DUF1349 domain-containing protein [Paenibacillus sp. JNUCC-31]QOS79502.1 DUF1349 domain-containing protein [Paenibacillus sp. JNUCC-31]